MDFHDGNISLGTAQLDDAGVAKLRTNTLSSGAHSLTATYEGDAKFSGSTSAPVAINIVAADFSFLVDYSTATVAAGQSTQFVLTVTPSGGFAGNVTFSCSPVTGIACTVEPPTLTPSSHSVTTSLTVTASANSASLDLTSIATSRWSALLGLAILLPLLSLLRGRHAQIRMLSAKAALALFAMAVMSGGCGSSGGKTITNHRIALVQVTARGDSVSHTTTLTLAVD